MGIVMLVLMSFMIVGLSIVLVRALLLERGFRKRRAESVKRWYDAMKMPSEGDVSGEVVDCTTDDE